MRVRIHSEAEEEFADAVAFYNRRQPGLGADLASEVEIAVSSIREDPESFPFVLRDVRRCRVRRFPYDVYFRVEGQVLRILVLKHDARDPAYWTHRLRSSGN
jgi:plasmid stabilization system protein ParE